MIGKSTLKIVTLFITMIEIGETGKYEMIAMNTIKVMMTDGMTQLITDVRLMIIMNNLEIKIMKIVSQDLTKLMMIVRTNIMSVMTEKKIMMIGN